MKILILIKRFIYLLERIIMLTEKEMYNIEGGKVSWSIVGAVGAILTLIAGIIDGYLRPLKCNK